MLNRPQLSKAAGDRTEKKKGCEITRRYKGPCKNAERKQSNIRMQEDRTSQKREGRAFS